MSRIQLTHFLAELPSSDWYFTLLLYRFGVQMILLLGRRIEQDGHSIKNKKN
jgi:hypothetical protein